MSAYGLVQGLLFIVEEPQQRSISEDESSEPQPAAAYYIILPNVYVTANPTVVSFFEEKSVPIVNAENVSQLLPYVDRLRAIEVFLDGSLEEYEASPIVVAPANYLAVIQQLLGSFPVIFHLNDKPIRSTVDDVSIKAMERLSSLKPDIPCDFFFLQFFHSATVHICSGNLLHLAASSGNVEFVRSLLDQGADIHTKSKPPIGHTQHASNLSDETGLTPLHLAVMGDFASAVELIIERGADVNAKDSKLFTPLHYALELDVVEILLENGANVNSLDRYKLPAMLQFIGNSKIKGNWSRVPKGLMLFLKYGAKFDAKYMQNPCLLWALLNHNGMVFQFILESSLVVSTILNDTDLHEDVLKSTVFIRDRFARHLVKVVALLQLPDPENVVATFWSDEPTSLDDFRRECELEISRLKSEIITDTTTSLFDVLSISKYELCGLLRNESISRALCSREAVVKFPLYGEIFQYHLYKGTYRYSFMEFAGESLSLLSVHFKELPDDDIKNKILGYLNVTDLLNLKRAILQPNCCRASTGLENLEHLELSVEKKASKKSRKVRESVLKVWKFFSSTRRVVKFFRR